MPPPLISFSDVAFSYSGRKEDYLFTKLSFGIDSDSRIALVGPNGAGKSTLLKLMVRENNACEGTVNVKSGLVIGRYHQHSAEVLDDALTPVEYISKKFHVRGGGCVRAVRRACTPVWRRAACASRVPAASPPARPAPPARRQDAYPEKKPEEWRGVVGNWGIPSDYHLLPISCLSDGLKTRLVFCEIALRKPHILLLDEPTNAADMEMIDSMAAAIKAFPGGVVVISHDFRLLSQVAEEIWVVDHGVKKWHSDIVGYKKHLVKLQQQKVAKVVPQAK